MLSVARVLSNPAFAETVIVRRTAFNVGIDGVSHPVVQEEVIPAVVQAGGGDAMILFPDAARVGGTMEIHTTFPLQATTQTTQADAIIWQGRPYVVRMVSDYQSVAGYSTAICTSTDLVATI
jgi:hypothetical protein